MTRPRGTHVSKAEHNLLLQAILPGCERVERHEEIHEVTAVPSFGLNVKQTLPRDLLRDSIVEAQVMRANVDASVCAEVVIGDLRDH